MKTKILYVCLIISLLVNIALSVFVAGQKLEGNYIYQTEIDRSRSMVPDEKTAERIAEAFLDTIEGDWGWEENVEYQVEVAFDVKSYEWIVCYRPKAPEGSMVIDGAKTVGVRKDNGMLTFYAWK